MTAVKKVQLSLRIPGNLSEKITEKSLEMGISANALITLILTKEISNAKPEILSQSAN